MNKNILVVEDEEAIRKLISIYLRKQRYSVFEAEDGREALSIFKTSKIDLVILDVMIPYINGFDVLKIIRHNSDVPVILLTAKSLEDDKLKGYECGTDEYVTKPFSPKVLVARVNSLIKRIYGNVKTQNNEIQMGELSLNTDTGIVKVSQKEIKLTKKEYDLLVYFVSNKDMILSKNLILDRIWGIDYLGDPRTVDTHITRLREKLGEMGKSIVTVRGRGYKFEVANENI